MQPYSESDMARFVPEVARTSTRTPFARDRARVLHSVGLRRLAAKTQVMVPGQSDFPRTRLTHTLEVAQIAREIGAALGCDADLVEVAGLAHDLGHPPFGHNGEGELDRIADDIGGFEGNAQTLRVLTRLEAKITDAAGNSRGLNLTRASLDASCKYPWPRRSDTRKFGYYADDAEIFHWLREGAPAERRCLEEQVMDWADDVAYSVHDVEDAVHGGLVELASFASEEVATSVASTAKRLYEPDRDIETLRAALQRLMALPMWPGNFDGSMRALVGLKAFTSTLIGRFCTAAQDATLAAYGHGPLVRYAADLVIPDEQREEVSVMKAITAQYVMDRPGAAEEYAAQRTMIAEVVNALQGSAGSEIEPWLKPAWDAASTDAERFRVVIDQVASLTDVSIVDWHRRLVRHT
jgi:dGTPase